MWWVRHVPSELDRLYRAMGYYTEDRLFRFVRIVDPEQMAQLIVGMVGAPNLESNRVTGRPSRNDW